MRSLGTRLARSFHGYRTSPRKCAVAVQTLPGRRVCTAWMRVDSEWIEWPLVAAGGRPCGDGLQGCD